MPFGASHDVNIMNRSGREAGVLSIYIIEKLKESFDLPGPQDNIAIIVEDGPLPVSAPLKSLNSCLVSGLLVQIGKVALEK
jgi:hypothetical protein